jgi:imidazoleglycerol-phosphate dehydratase
VAESVAPGAGPPVARAVPAHSPADGATGRVATLERSTRETEISLRLDLDGAGAADVDTGVPFFDHMLDQLARHAPLDLTLRCRGDLRVDTHHTVEDCALVLGQALHEALGDRRGIRRMGAARVPMDEALAEVALDLSGRPFCRAEVGDAGSTGLPPSLVAHFLEGLAAGGRLTLHVRVLYGRDGHHQAEAVFKALARALGEAVAPDPRRGGAVPSTKGTLTG